MMEEWARPVGRRSKSPAIVKFMFSAMMQRAMLAPMVWILVTLLDGKCFVCAFSISVDPKHFSGMPNNTGLDVIRILAKVPCKEDVIFQDNTFRKAVSRYLRCWSQAFGWSILLILIVLGAVARTIKPCFDHATFLQTRYWSNYLDMEQKLFDETCCLHAREFARQCVIQFFENMSDEAQAGLPPRPISKDEDEEDYLHGVTKQKEVNKAFGWIFLLMITLLAFMVRAIRPCFTQAAFLKTKYWSHYIDIERKMFDETCTEHAKSFAKVCIQQYFESISGEMRQFHGHNCKYDDEDNGNDDKNESEQDKLLGIRAQDEMNKVLRNWHTCKPPLNLKKECQNGNANGHAELNHTNEPFSPKKEWVTYYSKV
ncbi:calcium homeostasis modulator 1 isoform X1 [Lepisosteus oculatus]|uniref:calcium homeostasis modulator 1 isoform X1 n=1 Tax=Lepisosteus oculatus TaxID=7918 RepID=UPI0037126340